MSSSRKRENTGRSSTTTTGANRVRQGKGAGRPTSAQSSRKRSIETGNRVKLRVHKGQACPAPSPGTTQAALESLREARSRLLRLQAELESLGKMVAGTTAPLRAVPNARSKSPGTQITARFSAAKEAAVAAFSFAVNSISKGTAAAALGRRPHLRAV